MLKRILFLLALAFLASPLLFAQVTTSSINGKVTSNTDEALTGATVVATHVPTGTRYTTTSGNGGAFGIQNMRPGGPYTIVVTYVGYDLETFNDVYLALGETFTLSPALKKTNATLENVVLTTARRSIFNPNRTGAVTNINLRNINNTPVFGSRSINDLTRATPQSNRNAFGGGNYRQTNFTVDGAEYNNSFGIGTSNVPGGGAPISLDALEEIAISLTPFDVRQSGFIGAAINAVTRSGTNTFSASVYNYYRNQNNRGNKVGKQEFLRTAEEFDLWGARIGGPIIKNKLFFFLSWEKESTPTILQTRVAATATSGAGSFGSATNIARPLADSLRYISNYLLENYGWVSGPFDNYSDPIERDRIVARIDWNIDRKSRMILRYSQIEGGRPSSISGSLNSAGTTVAGFSPTTGNGTRTSINSMWYQNSNYFQGENFYSFSAELNSKFGKLANTFRGTYTFQNEDRTTNSPAFPLVDVLSTGGGTSTVPNVTYGVLGSPYVAFGHEPFSFNNLRKVKTYSIIDYISWTKNKHNWIVGGQYDLSKTINSFYPFGTSYYRFASWADFASALDPNPANRKLPTDFAITFALNPDFAPAFPSFTYNQYSLYGQDEIVFNRNFRMTLGLRLDYGKYRDVDEIRTNPLLLSLNFDNGEKINSGVLPENRVQFSPRLGFNWDLYGDRSLQIRGGTGIFTGKIPPVWVVAQSAGSAMLITTIPYNRFDGNGNLTGVTPPGPFNPNPVAYRPATVPTAGTILNAAATVAMDPNFKNPQTWKSSLAMDKKLPWGMSLTIEGLYNKDIWTIFPVAINLKTPAPLSTTGYPDNRNFYGATVQTRFINTLNGAVPTVNGATAYNPIVIKNGKRGHYFSLTTKLEKSFSKGFSASIAYSKSFANNVHDGNGDQPSGVWSATPTVNGSNYATMSHADYVVPDRVVGFLSYRKEYFKHMATTISVFYNGSINGRFSYVYGTDFNRDGVTGNDLIYIPKDATNPQEISFGTANVTVNGVSYTPAQQAQIFENYIRQDKYLRNHRGQYAERNGAQLPWLNRWDVKLMQDLFVKVGKDKHTLQFTVDVFNFGNLINPEWGKEKSVNVSSILNATITGVNPGGTTVPTFTFNRFNSQWVLNTFRDNVSIFSTYSMQFGFRYLFN